MMSATVLSRETAEAALLGGAVLGGGGGGSLQRGRINAEAALSLGEVRLLDVGDVEPDATLVTGSAVGAPASKEAQALPKDYVRAMELLSENGCPQLGGFIPNECGGSSITNGWISAALMGLPVVDAPCNGRAHPTGVMGSMGLHRDPHYVSRQAAVGGDPEKGLYLEVFVSGGIELAASVVRHAADRAGGLVAVARNPVKASYAGKFGAPGALRQAIALGMRMLDSQSGGGEVVVRSIVDFLGGSVVLRSEVSEIVLETRGGFDVGRVLLGPCEMTFWNEYMTLELCRKRLGTFPDLIMTLREDSGLPVTTAELCEGDRVFVIHVPAERLILGEGMRCGELLRAVEPMVGKPIL